jgi:hypothetical protein
MKHIAILLVIAALTACQSNETSIDTNLTGNETVYTLYQGSDYNVSGTVTFQETVSKSTIVEIVLLGTEDGQLHPTHLHFDDIAGNGEIAAVLNPVEGVTGTSTTTLEFFRDMTPVTYAQILEMEGSVKVHLSDTEPGKHVILAGGNIGISDDKNNPFGRITISVCKSN